MALAASFDGQTTKFVIFKVAIATEQQPVTLGSRRLELSPLSLAQQVARRIVQEAFGQLTAHLQQPIQRVVAVALLPLHAVIDLQQVTGAVIAVTPLTGGPLLTLQAQGGQTPLLVVFILLGQGTLAAAHLKPGQHLVTSQLISIEIDATQGTVQIVVIETIAVRQPPLGELPHDVVLEVAGSPPLMLGNQIAAPVIFKGKRPDAIMDLGQLAMLVIGELDFTAIRQQLPEQSPHGITLIAGNQLCPLPAKFHLLTEVTIEIVAIGGGAAIETGFPLNQPVGGVVDAVLLAVFILDLAQEQLGIVVAILELTAIGVDAPAHQVQARMIFETGLASLLIPLRRYLAIRVVFETAATTAWQMYGQQAIGGIPLIASDGPARVAHQDLATPFIIAPTGDAAVAPFLFDQLAKAIPDQFNTAAIGLRHPAEFALCRVAITGLPTERIHSGNHIALLVALETPLTIPLYDFANTAIPVAVGRLVAIRGNLEGEQTRIVILIPGLAPQGIASQHLLALVVVVKFSDCTVRILLAHQAGIVVMTIDFDAAVDTLNRHLPLVVIPAVADIEAGDIAPVTNGAGLIPLPFPLPEKSGAACETTLQDHSIGPVAVALLLTRPVLGGGKPARLVVVIALQG
ncbi:hypothetical protein D3C79_480810 [compost metagenome]